MDTPNPLSDAHCFTHDAMNTTFTLRIRGVDAADASGMAHECMDLLDYLENKLSRFIENSDVSRINAMQAGETLYISESCHQCLLLALAAHADTAGLFDITVGTHIAHQKNHGTDAPPELTGRITIHPDVPAVSCDEAGRQIDFGGIGKGYALDQLRQTLEAWGADDFLLAAGASSLLAHGPSSWPVELSGTSNSLLVSLHEQSLSASGTAIQGSHIVHPAGPHAMPATPCTRLWVTADTAALAEIWSTALMLIPVEEIPDFIKNKTAITGVFTDRAGIVAQLR